MKGISNRMATDVPLVLVSSPGCYGERAEWASLRVRSNTPKLVRLICSPVNRQMDRALLFQAERSAADCVSEFDSDGHWRSRRWPGRPALDHVPYFVRYPPIHRSGGQSAYRLEECAHHTGEAPCPANRSIAWLSHQRQCGGCGRCRLPPRQQ